jgi:hypothetical protein
MHSACGSKCRNGIDLNQVDQGDPFLLIYMHAFPTRRTPILWGRVASLGPSGGRRTCLSQPNR